MLKKLVNYVGIAAALAVPLVFVSAQAVEAKTCEFERHDFTDDNFFGAYRVKKVPSNFFYDSLNSWKGVGCTIGINTLPFDDSTDLVVYKDTVFVAGKFKSTEDQDFQDSKPQLLARQISLYNKARLVDGETMSPTPLSSITKKDSQLIVNKILVSTNSVFNLSNFTSLIGVKDITVSSNSTFVYYGWSKENPFSAASPLPPSLKISSTGNSSVLIKNFDTATLSGGKVANLDIVGNVAFDNIVVRTGTTLNITSDEVGVRVKSLVVEKGAVLKGSDRFRIVLDVDDVVLMTGEVGDGGKIILPLKSDNYNKFIIRKSLTMGAKSQIISDGTLRLDLKKATDVNAVNLKSGYIKVINLEIENANNSEIAVTSIGGLTNVRTNNFIIKSGAKVKTIGITFDVYKDFENNGILMLGLGSNISGKKPTVKLWKFRDDESGVLDWIDPNTSLLTPVNNVALVVVDETANLDSTQKETITVDMHVGGKWDDVSLDIEKYELEETKPNSGVFKSKATPIVLLAKGQKFTEQNKILEVDGNVTIYAKYLNAYSHPTDGGTVSEDYAVKAAFVNLGPTAVSISPYSSSAQKSKNQKPGDSPLYTVKFSVANLGNRPSGAFLNKIKIVGYGGETELMLKDDDGIGANDKQLYAVLVKKSVLDLTKNIKEIVVTTVSDSDYIDQNNAATLTVDTDLSFVDGKNGSPIKIINSNLNSFTVEYNMVNKGVLPTGQFKIKHVVHGTDGAKKKTYEYTYTGLKGNQTEEFSFAIPKKDLAELKNLTELQVMLDSGTEVPEGDENNNITELKLFRKMQIGEASAEVKLDQFLFPSAYIISVPVSNSGNVPAGPFEVVATAQLKFHNTDDDTYSDYPPTEYKVAEKVGLNPGKTEKYEINVPTGRNDELVSVSVEVRSLSQIADDAEPDQN